MDLIVKSDFGDYRRGDRISDADRVSAALESNPHHVVRVDGEPLEEDHEDVA